MNNKFVFLCPGAYTIRKRMVSKNKRLGLFCYHIVPVAFLYMLSHVYSICSLVEFVLLLVAFYAQYEIGYIYNDTETIKKEKNPSKRLDSIEMYFYNKNKCQIYIVHFLTFICILSGLSWMSDEREFLLFSAISMIVELVIFYVYNNVRGRISLLVFFFLELFKYIPFLNLFDTESAMQILIVTAMIYAIPNTLERLSFKRYGILFMQRLLPTEKSYLKFRIAFYLVVCLCMAMFKQFLIYIPLFLFLLVFRGMAFLKAKREK